MGKVARPVGLLARWSWPLRAKEELISRFLWYMYYTASNMARSAACCEPSGRTSRLFGFIVQCHKGRCITLAMVQSNRMDT